jgi:hypothetical protein
VAVYLQGLQSAYCESPALYIAGIRGLRGQALNERRYRPRVVVTNKVLAKQAFALWQLEPFAGVAACNILKGAEVRSEMRFRTGDIFETQTIWQVSRTGPVTYGGSYVVPSKNGKKPFAVETLRRGELERSIRTPKLSHLIWVASLDKTWISRKTGSGLPMCCFLKKRFEEAS